MIVYRPSAKFDKEAALVLLDQDQVREGRFPFFHPPLKSALQDLVRAGQFSGEDSELFPLVVRKRTVVLAGVGKRDKLSLTALRVTARKALLSSYLRKVKDVEIIVHEQRDDTVKAVIEAVLIGTYAWKKYKTKDAKDKTVDRKNIFLAAPPKKVYDDTAAVCAGVNLTRDLVNDNADTVTSDYMEKIIRGLVKGRKDVSLEVFNRKELKQKGLGLHLAVNQGSKKEPKLIIVKYKGSPSSGDWTAVVGKGITFDTGGLNLKPSGHIETMRLDMSGAGAVAGILSSVLALKVKRNVLFACALAENAVSADSYKPGDVIKGYSGKTVEVGNTDAEGRLVLADAISYIVQNYKPARMIDMATLTGACVVALGHDYTGLMGNDEKLVKKLIHAAEQTDDRVWQLPVYPELKEAVKSKIADIKNTGFPKGAAGTITAAEFLRQFAGDTPWAHLDIAGTAFVENQERLYFGHGATGVGVRLLTCFLQNG